MNIYVCVCGFCVCGVCVVCVCGICVCGVCVCVCVCVCVVCARHFICMKIIYVIAPSSPRNPLHQGIFFAKNPEKSRNQNIMKKIKK